MPIAHHKTLAKIMVRHHKGWWVLHAFEVTTHARNNMHCSASQRLVTTAAAATVFTIACLVLILKVLLSNLQSKLMPAKVSE